MIVQAFLLHTLPVDSVEFIRLYKRTHPPTTDPNLSKHTNGGMKRITGAGELIPGKCVTWKHHWYRTEECRLLGPKVTLGITFDFILSSQGVVLTQQWRAGILEPACLAWNPTTLLTGYVAWEKLLLWNGNIARATRNIIWISACKALSKVPSTYMLRSDCCP